MWHTFFLTFFLLNVKNLPCLLIYCHLIYFHIHNKFHKYIFECGTQIYIFLCLVRVIKEAFYGYHIHTNKFISQSCFLFFAYSHTHGYKRIFSHGNWATRNVKQKIYGCSWTSYFYPLLCYFCSLSQVFFPFLLLLLLHVISTFSVAFLMHFVLDKALLLFYDYSRSRSPFLFRLKQLIVCVCMRTFIA